VELSPSTLQFQDTLGWVHRARGELDLAASVLERATAAPDAHQAEMLSQIFEHLGVVYHEQGKIPEAARALHQSEALRHLPALEQAAKEVSNDS
jgi:lipopolysaccharide biosynthesis regulator YciM